MRIFLGLATCLLLACGGSKSNGDMPAPIGNQGPAPVGDDSAAPRPPGGGGTGGDSDGDGTVDSNDMCPSDPEDFDGFEDEDGCPDPDNDRDGISDMSDKCPNDPESFDGQTDDDGCPP